MPYISLRVAGKLSRQQKTAIAKEFAETLERHAAKPKDSTYLVFDEVERENWAKGDQLLG
jgi:4-oxalocrotonate tautomerase